MRQALISVIVPVYKVERYLDRCVESIVNQTYSNLEIILVDDGSPDNCPAMCDTWAAKDHRIKVVHKKNGGLSDARNAGMAVATGELMGFVDSDDWISPDMYQLLYENMREHNSDISVCGIQLDFEDGTPSRMLTRSGVCVLDANAAMQAVIEETWLLQPVVQKLYKSALLRGILFPTGKYHEDVFWTYQAVGRTNRVSVFDKPCYFYTQRSGSIMGEGYSLKRLDALEAKILRVRYLQKFYPMLVSEAKCNFWFSCIYAMQMLLKYCTPAIRKEGIAVINTMLHAVPIQLDCVDNKNKKQQIWLIMAKLSFGTTCRIRNLLGIGF